MPKNPADSANLGQPSYVAKDDMARLVHRARTTMRPVRPRGRKKRVLPGFKDAYQAIKRDAREEAERLKAEEAKKSGEALHA